MQPRCKGCASEYNKKRYELKRDEIRKRVREYSINNSEAVSAYQKKWYVSNFGKYLLKRYGITPKQYEKMLEDQDRKCACCGKAFGAEKAVRPHVDHCHKTGVVRGLLCLGCDSSEGLLKTVENARKLVAYMERNVLFYNEPN